jgi:hypothetical protein
MIPGLARNPTTGLPSPSVVRSSLVPPSSGESTNVCPEMHLFPARALPAPADREREPVRPVELDDLDVGGLRPPTKTCSER